ncbi:hypothetical protein PM082_015139 [Marasmius tenuissimus]|nr:hypothetical protein PM082_015139 [Marasmius tenuissimus]
MPSGACLNSTVHDESLFPADPMEPPSSSSSSSSASSSESSNKPIHSLNCFILFRSEFCKESNLQGESHPGAQLSKRAAIAWKQLAPEEKKPWRNLASLKKRQHKSEQKCAKTSRSFHEVRSAGAGFALDSGSSCSSVVTPSTSTSFSAAPLTQDPDFPMSDETFLSCFSALTLRDPMEESNYRLGLRSEIYPSEPQF